MQLTMIFFGNAENLMSMLVMCVMVGQFFVVACCPEKRRGWEKPAHVSYTYGVRWRITTNTVLITSTEYLTWRLLI
jgi:hypothetical protein